jgi:hypothetical protein
MPEIQIKIKIIEETRITNMPTLIHDDIYEMQIENKKDKIKNKTTCQH